MHGTLPHNASATKILLQRRNRRNKARSDKRFSKFHHVPSYFIVLGNTSTHTAEFPTSQRLRSGCPIAAGSAASQGALPPDIGKLEEQSNIKQVVFHANPEATVPPCFFVATPIHVHEFRRHVEVT